MAIFAVGFLFGQVFLFPGIKEAFPSESYEHLYSFQKVSRIILFEFPFIIDQGIETLINATCPPVTGMIASWPHRDCDVREEAIAVFTFPVSFGIYYGLALSMAYLLWIRIGDWKNRKKIGPSTWLKMGFVAGASFVYGISSVVYSSFCLIWPNARLCEFVTRPYGLDPYLYGLNWFIRVLLLPFNLGGMLSALADQPPYFQEKTSLAIFTYYGFLPLLLTMTFFMALSCFFIQLVQKSVKNGV